MKYMSQKDGKFQSKPRFGGQKFGGKGKGAGRSFSKKFEGDSGERPARSNDRPYDRDARPPRRDDANAGEGRKDFRDKGRKDFGDRPPRREFSDKPYKKREFSGEGRKDFGDRPPRRDFGDKPYKKREFGDKKPYQKDHRFDNRPQKKFERYDERPVKKEWPEDRPSAGAKLKSDRPSYGAPSSAYLYGIHAVTQALLNPKRLHQRLLCTQKGYESLQETWAEALEDGIKLPEITYVEKEDLERLLPRDAVHQDVLLDCQPLENEFLVDILAKAPENAKVIVLDQVTDPHNVGAILRSAAAFGATAVIMQKLHAPDITGTLAKAASGAVDIVPIVREVNLSRALEQLKEAGFFCLGLAEEGKQTLASMNMTGKTALVLGAEGSGLRRLVAENCDELVKLPTQEPIASLNVSNAAAVALYELTRSKTS